ncbi:MAG: DNA-methyltransferase [Candidatus Brocadiales bacterium]
MYRIPNQKDWPNKRVNKILQADALHALRQLPDGCIALVVTSPPYWNTINYGFDGQIGQTSYGQYLHDLLAVWEQTYRVLIPNGKIAIVTPIMPISKSIVNDQHTRHIKNISNDIEQTILLNIKGLKRYSLFIWQKQTSVKMFGSYPYPPNIYEDNTIEFINVFTKEGVPSSIPLEAKKPSKITKEEWRNLTMQVWPIYPEDVKRAGGHPCPFPVTLPQRLIMMYTFKEAPEVGFKGDIVLDMFNGAGATCIAARAAGRNWIGIDLNPEYCDIARYRVARETRNPYKILLEHVRVKQPRDSRQLLMFPESVFEDSINYE